MAEPEDPMDARLRQYAVRWRDAAAPPPAVDADGLRPGRRSPRSWWVAAVSAAAVAAVIVGGTQLVGNDRDGRPSDPAGTGQPTETAKPGDDVVPWAALPATHPQLPTETTPPSPDPAEAAGKPPCRASDLRAATSGGAAAGTHSVNVRLALVGSSPCRLEGYPDLVLLDRGRPVDIPLRRDGAGAYPGPVLVAAGHPGVLRLSWSSDWCSAPVRNDSIRMALPGGSLTFRGFGGSSCYGTPGSGSRAPVDVTPFQPLTWRDAAVRSPYADLQVGADLDVAVAAAAPLEFTITLTSPTDLVLDPCPDYRIVQNAEDGEHQEAYALNCAAVPHKDDQGRPYLPAGTPVRFAMRTTVAGQGPSMEKLGWTLDTADQKGVAGTLTVSAGPAQTGPTTAAPLGPGDRRTVRSAVTAIQAYLDTWRRDGMFLAARQYVEKDAQPPSAVGLPRLSSGKVLHADLSSWESADHFTLEVALDLHIVGDPLAWNDGENDRFVTVTRDGGGFRLAFATSP